jgi:hypothetical protein
MVQTLEDRIVADENWVYNEAAMPVGLISDMMLVGIPNDSEAAASAGAVWVFKREGGQWVQKQKILPVDPLMGMHFGWSLSVEEQIDTGEAWLVVGAPHTNTSEGRVYLFERSGDTWVHNTYLTTDQSDFYGFDVDINVDIPIGQEEFQWTMVAGAPSYRFDGKQHNTGTVFISSRSGSGNWPPGAIPLGADTITSVNPQVGRAVAIDGDVVIAGAPS